MREKFICIQEDLKFDVQIEIIAPPMKKPESPISIFSRIIREHLIVSEYPLIALLDLTLSNLVPYILENSTLTKAESVKILFTLHKIKKNG